MGHCSSRQRALLVLTSLLLGFLICDLWRDFRNGGWGLHLALELLAAFFFPIAIFFLLRHVNRLMKHVHDLGADLRRANEEAQKWQSANSKLMRSLSEAVDLQFQKWNASEAEKQIGLLLLKGMSHKEIAKLRHTSERTVRQQALALYSKAGLAGRAELSAFFLDGLFNSTDPQTSAGSY